LPRSIIEFYYKNDQLNDPMVSEEHITAFGWAHAAGNRRHHGAGDPRQRLPHRAVFWASASALVDFKMECGRLFENEMMRIIVADEISPDFLQAVGHQVERKSSTRTVLLRARTLGGVLEAYTEVAKTASASLMENERPAGSGPVLVKG